MFTARPHITEVAVAPGRSAFVIDDALVDPQGLVEFAVAQRGAFIESPHNAYPGPELRLSDAATAPLDALFSEHLRRRLGARRTLRMYARLSIATRTVDGLEPRQWIAHRDRLDDDPERIVAACVLYLFRAPALGGTAFFRPNGDARATALGVHESGVLDGAAFARRYAAVPGYPHADNALFTRTGEVEARWNRLVFYDGGALFHGSAIRHPDCLSGDVRRGRLTLNGFFVCRAQAR